MIVHTDSIKIKTEGEFDIIDLTDKVKKIVDKSKVNNGILNVYSPGATGCVVINQNEENLKEDYKATIEHLVKKDLPFKHYENARSHVRSMVLSPTASVPIRENKLKLGTWQAIMFIELDTRPRNRNIEITALGSIKLQEEF